MDKMNFQNNIPESELFENFPNEDGEVVEEIFNEVGSSEPKKVDKFIEDKLRSGEWSPIENTNPGNN